MQGFQKTQILDEDGIRTDVGEELHEGDGIIHLGVLDQGVDRDVALHAAVVGVVDRPFQLGVGEVAGEGSRSEGLSAEVDCIASSHDGGHQSFRVARGREYFHVCRLLF